MDSVSLVYKYFPDLSARQKKQFENLQGLYEEWNAKINVISRKDVAFLYEKHCLHSLGIAKIYSFLPHQTILDVGTGGGFPGIPLAILFPQTKFYLVDSIQKKIKVVKEVAAALNLQNVEAHQQRAEKVSGKFDFVVSRAVTRMKPFHQWVQQKINVGKDINGISHGILYLKGGDLQEEMSELNLPYHIHPLSSHFQEAFFDTKQVIHVPFS